jgi:hypothetical protein
MRVGWECRVEGTCLDVVVGIKETNLCVFLETNHTQI